METKRLRAVVVHEVADPPPSGDMVEDEPRIQLENGLIVAPIWVHRFISKGIEGWAEFVPEKNAWRFTPDDK